MAITFPARKKRTGDSNNDDSGGRKLSPMKRRNKQRQGNSRSSIHAAARRARGFRPSSPARGYLGGIPDAFPVITKSLATSAGPVIARNVVDLAARANAVSDPVALNNPRYYAHARNSAFAATRASRTGVAKDIAMTLSGPLSLYAVNRFNRAYTDRKALYQPGYVRPESYLHRTARHAASAGIAAIGHAAVPHLVFTRKLLPAAASGIALLTSKDPDRYNKNKKILNTVLKTAGGALTAYSGLRGAVRGVTISQAYDPWIPYNDNGTLGAKRLVRKKSNLAKKAGRTSRRR